MQRKLDSWQLIQHQVESRETCLEMASNYQDKRITTVERTLHDQSKRISQLELASTQDNYHVLKTGNYTEISKYFR